MGGGERAKEQQRARPRNGVQPKERWGDALGAGVRWVHVGPVLTRREPGRRSGPPHILLEAGDDLLQHREEIAAKVRVAVEQFVSQWGLHVEAIAMQDIQLPKEMQEVIARVPIGERERQYVVIESRADPGSPRKVPARPGISPSTEGAARRRPIRAGEQGARWPFAGGGPP